MEILEYSHLDTSSVGAQYQKVIAMLRRDDFVSAEVKKLKPTDYYRAKLNHSDRLLFKFICHDHKNYLLILEVIRNHAYDKSRFLNGASIDESQIILPTTIDQHAIEPIKYINPNNACIHVLDKIISFDDEQNGVYQVKPPMIVVGSAGSGKTVLVLEKIKNYSGDILYVTHSKYLAQNSRNLYYANSYENENQNLDFLSYQEFLESIQVPKTKEIDFNIFSDWFRKQCIKERQFKDAYKVFEEFKGVLTGSVTDHAYLSLDDYLNLGIKQSIFLQEEREFAYNLFRKYLAFLQETALYDNNILSFEYLEQVRPHYDVVVVDEVQDVTMVQLQLILRSLKITNNFILCGDANQIVHPNFFSWAKVKTFFYQNAHRAETSPQEIIRFLFNNYRNTATVTAFANNILQLKTARFGSLDKESHFLVTSRSQQVGRVHRLPHVDTALKELNNKTRRSTKYAVIVLHEDLKLEVRKYLQTPLVFSIREAKGLEYDNIILYNFVSCEETKYLEIVRGITAEDFNKDFIYARAKDKTDKAAEIYKFYINALYVAVTRAIKNVYFVENTRKHPLFDLLKLNEQQENFNLDNLESSKEEWQQEARKLELLGKQEQAEEIRKTILSTETPPWQIMDNAYCQRLLSPTSGKQEKILLLEYAILYKRQDIIKALQQTGLKAANNNPVQALDFVCNKYFSFYISANNAGVIRDVDRYGIDFRNQFNLTPLMVAALLGNTTLIKELINRGANIYLTDNRGRNAFSTALENIFSNEKFARVKLISCYDLLAPDSINIQVEGKLLKLDKHLMEYFLLNLLMVLLPKLFYEGQARSLTNIAQCRDAVFCVDSFLNSICVLPQGVLREYRKQRQYISSVLAKNTVGRIDAYNRQLFVRVRRGYYMLNPKLEIKIENDWFNIYKFLGIEISETMKATFAGL